MSLLGLRSVCARAPAAYSSAPSLRRFHCARFIARRASTVPAAGAAGAAAAASASAPPPPPAAPFYRGGARARQSVAPSHVSGADDRWPAYVKIVEVGPRDGLQNEARAVPTATKVALIDRLSGAGLHFIEATSFVSRRWVPQMGDAAEVLAGIRRAEGVRYSALTPNAQGLAGAVAARADEVAVFAAASDAFSQRNINVGVLESLARFRPLAAAAREAGLRVRGYVSCVMGCPYSGAVEPEAVGFVAQSLLELGCYEVSLGDTIGVGTPRSTRRLLEAVRRHVPMHTVAVHLHNTFGCALPNILTAMEMGVTVVDRWGAEGRARRRDGRGRREGR